MVPKYKMPEKAVQQLVVVQKFAQVAMEINIIRAPMSSLDMTFWAIHVWVVLALFLFIW